MVADYLNTLRWAVKCQAHRSDGAPCKRWATRGAYVCASHGARAPQVRRAAHDRLIELGARKLLASLGERPYY
jgi:hypothetical protein